MSKLLPLEKARLVRDFASRIILTEEDLDTLIYETYAGYRPPEAQEVKDLLEKIADVITE